MLKKKYALLFMAVLVLLLAGCENKTPEQPNIDLTQFKTDYVGNAPNVVNIVKNQIYPDGYTYNSIEIQSGAEPYGLIVYLNCAVNEGKYNDDLKANADQVFELVGNLGSIEYRDSDSKKLVAKYNKN